MVIAGNTRDAKPVETNRRRQFLALWTASSAGYLGVQIARFILPLIAASISRSPALVSAVALALAAPWLIAGLPAGALVDRLDRKRVLIAVDVLRMAALAVLGGAAVAGLLAAPVLLLVAGALGVADVFAETALAALVPAVAGESGLDRANSRLYGARSGIEIVAAPVGGVLVAASLGLASFASLLCVAVGLVGWKRLRGRFSPTADAPRQHLVAETRDGLRFLWRHALLRTVTLMAAAINACWSAWAALLVLYAVTPGPLGLSPARFGLLMTASGFGGLLGALAAEPLQRLFGRRWAFGVNIAVNAGLFAVTAFTVNPWFVAPALLLGDIGGPLWGIATLSLQVRSTPDALRGRVASAYRFVSFGAMAIGPVIGGVLASRFGVQPVFAVCACCTSLLFVPFVRSITEQALRPEAPGPTPHSDPRAPATR